MTYANEQIAATLKAAREQKGLSQRDLKARAGVPQSHISKIENNAVDLRLSSLVAIAHALDLEIALVPRKAVSAVKSVARSVGAPPVAKVAIGQELLKIQKILKSFEVQPVRLKGLDALQRSFKEVHQFQNLLKDSNPLRETRKLLETVEISGGAEALKTATNQINQLRNRLAHGLDIAPAHGRTRPAYRLEDDEDGYG